MSIPSSFASHADAVKAGWFSRRHRTSEAHYETQRRFIADRAAKREREEQQHAETLRWKREHGARVAGVLV